MAAWLLCACMAACAVTATGTSKAASGSTLRLLSLDGGLPVAGAPVGTDAVAVVVSEDGATAYLADSAPGDVIAVAIPSLKTLWTTHVGGDPFGLLVRNGRLYCTLFDAAAVVELDVTTGRRVATYPVAPKPAGITVDARGAVVVASRAAPPGYLDGTSMPGAFGFGIATAAADVWSADFGRSALVRSDGHRVDLPLPVSPFWLARQDDTTLLVSAEGPREDADPGAVFSFDTLHETFRLLARPIDPDMVVTSGDRVYVAAHGDHHVLVVDSARPDSPPATWAPGSAVVALATDPAKNLLLVLENAHE